MINDGLIRYTEEELCDEVLNEMAIPHQFSCGVCNIDEDELAEPVIGCLTRSELKPFGADGYVQMYIKMLWTMIYRWFESNKIEFDSNDYVYINGWDADDEDDMDEDYWGDDFDADTKKALSLIKNEDWDSLQDELWRDFCCKKFKKYGIDVENYKMAENEDEED